MRKRNRAIREEEDNDPLSFIDEHLSPMLATTIFLHATKRILNIPIVASEFEELTRAFTENQAKELSLDPDTLQNFMALYSEISRKVQEYWYEQEDDFEYMFSGKESQILSCITDEIPAFEHVTSLTDIRNVLHSSEHFANQLIHWIWQTMETHSIALFNDIKTAEEDDGLDVTKITKKLSNALQETFVMNSVIEDTLIDAWADSLSQCSSPTTQMSFSYV